MHLQPVRRNTLACLSVYLPLCLPVCLPACLSMADHGWGWNCAQALATSRTRKPDWVVQLG